jgi:hypothetical protein
MAIYRAEQARLSFSAEAGAGGFMDNVTGGTTTASGWTARINVSGGLPAGSKSITIDTASSGTLQVGDYVQIDTTTETAEVRKVASLGTYNGASSAGTFFLDYPTGFDHADSVTVIEHTIAVGGTTGTSFATFLPGVYESISTPDMQTEFMPQWVASTSSARGFSRMYRGRQTFTGSLSNFILLNGYALRFALGNIASVANGSAGVSTDLNGATRVGDVRVTVTTPGALAANDFIQIGTGTAAEVREIISVATNDMILNYPLMQAHADAEAVEEVQSYFTHTITATAELPSMTWNVLMRDSGETVANDFIRRYVGGKVNRMTLSADEGEMLRCSWDDVQFLDIVHNQINSTGVTGEIAKSSDALIDPTQNADSDAEDGIGGAIPHDSGALGDASFPTDEPYYFSQGSLTMFGVEFARVKNFRLEVNNNLQAKYYIRDQGSSRNPNEIQEQRRDYSMTATIAMPDSVDRTATTRTLWKELMLEGNYDAGLEGFDIILLFTKGSNDTIQIRIPGTASADADTAFEGQGVFMTTAPHNIGTESPVEIEANMQFRQISIVIEDSNAVYP